MADRLNEAYGQQGQNVALGLYQAQKKQPRFSPGTHVLSPALVVDESGVAWWVDPEAKKIESASA